MKIILSLVLLGLISCTSRNKGESEFSKSLNALHASHSAKAFSCEKHEKNVLNKAIHEVKIKDNVTRYSFPKDEKLALEFIRLFDYSKIDHTSYDEKFKFYLNNCSEENFQDYEAFNKGKRICSDLFSEYNFFVGLIYGMSQYKWSSSTNKEGKLLLKDYLIKISLERYSLISELMGITLLKSFMDETHVTGKNRTDLENTVHILEIKTQELQAEVKVSPPKGCAEEKKFHAKEMALADEAGKELSKLIKSYL